MSKDGEHQHVRNREIAHEHWRFAIGYLNVAQHPRHRPVDGLHSIDPQALKSSLISLT